jgi:hypothetical protein
VLALVRRSPYSAWICTVTCMLHTPARIQIHTHWGAAGVRARRFVASEHQTPATLHDGPVAIAFKLGVLLPQSQMILANRCSGLSDGARRYDVAVITGWPQEGNVGSTNALTHAYHLRKYWLPVAYSSEPRANSRWAICARRPRQPSADTCHVSTSQHYM